MNFRVVVLCFLLGLSTAAGASDKLPLPLNDQLPVELVLNQQELGVDLADSASTAGAAGGMIGVMIGMAIDNAKAKNGEKRVVEIRNELADYPFDDKLEAAVRAKFPSPGLSPNPQITVVATPWNATTASQANEQSRTGILVVVPRYAITNTFESMKVSLQVNLVDRERKSNGKMKEHLRAYRTYSYYFNLNRILGSAAEEDARRWSDMGKPKLAALLDEAIDQLTDMVVFDFSAEGRADAAKSTRLDATVIAGTTYFGRRLHYGQGWAWVRYDSRRYGLANISGYHPITAPAAGAAAPASDISR